MVVVEDDGDIGDGERGGCCCRRCCLKWWRASTFTLLLFDHCESGGFFCEKMQPKVTWMVEPRQQGGFGSNGQLI